jgi:SPP1 family predicted phage head-tail adaptor
MRAGRLRHRVTIQIPAKTKNDIGEWYETFATWVTVWASIEPNSGKTYFEGLQANSEVEGKIVIRYRTGVKPTMRVKYGNRYFKILSIVHPQERKKELDLMYKESLD